MNDPDGPAPQGGRDDDLPATGLAAQSEPAPEDAQSDQGQPAEAEADPMPDDGYESL